MSTAKNIIENLEKKIGVPNAFSSKDLASQELYDAIEHEPRTVTVIDKDGNTTIRPMTQEEEANFENDFMCELENDMKDYN